MSNLRQLNPQEIKLVRQESGLCLNLGEQMLFEHITLVRTFPLTDPDRYWSVHDSSDQEIGIIVEPAALDPAARKLLDEELERRYFAPVIRRILAVQESHGELEWSVETDRGPSLFTTRSLRETILQPAPLRYIITDIDGNRFDIENFNSLDQKSQLLLMTHL